MLIGAIVISLTGLAMLYFGRRGLRIGHHPHCTQCNFNLYNLPPDTQRCPECGAYIHIEDAVRLGRRQQIRSVIAAGVLLTLVGCGLGLMSATDWWPTLDGSRFKTASWLMRDIHSADDKLQNRSCDELARRIRTGSLSNEQVDQLSDLLLRYQADTAIRWNLRWGDLIQAAEHAGRISEKRWQQYLEQAIQLTPIIRPKVRIDDPIPVALTCTLRGGTEYREIAPATLTPEVHMALGSISAPMRTVAATLDSIPMPVRWFMLWSPATEGENRWPAEIDRKGSLNAELAVKLTLTDKSGRTVCVSRDFALAFDALPREQSSVTLAGPGTPALKEQMEAAVRLRISERESLARAGASIGNLWISGPPIAAAFRVVLRQENPNREWPMGLVLVRPNDAANIPLILSPSDLPPSQGFAEVVCLPYPDIAVGTPDVLEIWPETMRRVIVFKESQ